MKSAVDIKTKISQQKQIALREQTISRQTFFPPEEFSHKIQALIATTFIAALSWVLEEENEKPDTSPSNNADSPEWQPGANIH